MVVSNNGETVGADSTSRSISNDEDRAHLMSLRSLADIIVTDAATARRERYRASKFAPIQIWQTSAAPLDFDPEQPEGSFPVTPVDSSHLPDALAGLRGLRTLLETGPTLSRLLASYIDEYVITRPNSNLLPTNETDYLSVISALLGQDFDNAQFWHCELIAGSQNDYLHFVRRGRREAQ